MTQTQVWTVLDALNWTVAYFEGAKLVSPRIDAQLLLAHVTGLTRIELYAKHDMPLSDLQKAKYRDCIKRRIDGVPIQYITHTAPFRFIELNVTPDVLIPRPETETLVQIVLDYLASLDDGKTITRHEATLCDEEMADLSSSSSELLPEDGPTITETCVAPTNVKSLLQPRKVLDLCTGSGCIALAIANENEATHVTATDISEAALEVARGNAEQLGLQDRVTFLHNDLFQPITLPRFRGPEPEYDVIVSNPPYVPHSEMTNLPAEVLNHEPILALDGGEDGLEIIERILVNAKDHLTKKGMVVLEVDERNATQAQELAVKLGTYHDVQVVCDLNNRQRFVRCMLG